jgi:hypothetical protein
MMNLPPADFPHDTLPAGAEWLSTPLLICKWLYRILWIAAFALCLWRGVAP